MQKKLRLDLTLDELEIFIRGLENSTNRNTLKRRDELAAKYLTKAISFNLATSSVMNAITKAISILTGRPQNTITPGSKLSDLSLTPNKKAQLRAYLNQYIKKQGGNSFISETEMDGASTVQDLIVLVETKTP